MPSMWQAAVEYISDAGRKVFLQTDILDYVADVTGRSKDSVRGTVCKTKGGIYSPVLLRKLGFRIERKPTRLVRTRPGERQTIYQSYKDEEKDRVRREVFDLVEKLTPCDTVVTLAGHEGLCVKEMRRRGWGRIINVEENDVAMDLYQELELGTEDYRATFATVFDNLLDEPVDFLNLDTMGYMSRGSAELYAKINQRTNCKVVAVCLQGIKNLRNKGAWVEAMRRNYADCDDPTDQMMKDLFDNYKLAQSHWYRKDNVKGARGMRVWVFVRKR